MVIKKILFLSFLSTDPTSSVLYKTVKDHSVHKCGSQFKFPGKVYSDGTAAMAEKQPGVATQATELAQSITSIHCFLYPNIYIYVICVYIYIYIYIYEKCQQN